MSMDWKPVTMALMGSWPSQVNSWCSTAESACACAALAFSSVSVARDRTVSAIVCLRFSIAAVSVLSTRSPTVFAAVNAALSMIARWPSLNSLRSIVPSPCLFYRAPTRLSMAAVLPAG